MEDDDKILRSRLCAKMLSVSEVVHISSGGFLIFYLLMILTGKERTWIPHESY